MKLRNVDYLSKNSLASIFFDLFRTLAAIEVTLYHIRPSYLVDYIYSDSKNIVMQLFYYLCTKGYQSVMMFFVLSGFFISSSVIGSMARGKWSWKTYLTNRITRLWIVLIPALVLTYLWCQISILLFHEQASIGFLSWSDFLINTFFLEGIGSFRNTPFGDNGALWSLSFEFWYYILFPCMSAVFYYKKWYVKIIFAVISIVICLLLGKLGISLFLVWLLGSLIVVLPSFTPPIKSMNKSIVIGFSLIIFAIPFVLSFRSREFLINFILGIGFAWLLYVIKTIYNNRDFEKGSLINRTILLGAGFSYTLYLTHCPINNLIVSWVGQGKRQISISSVSAFILIIIGVLFYAWLVSKVTEAKTDKARMLVHKALDFQKKERNIKVPLSSENV
jgi:peptidoglycan/LPS O-acetylase OafA/YrhL